MFHQERDDRRLGYKEDGDGQGINNYRWPKPHVIAIFVAPA